MAAGLPTYLMLTGAILIIFSLVALVWVARALRGLPEGRRVLYVQLAIMSAFAVSASTRSYLLAVTNPMDPRASLVLGTLDATLAGLFWWTLRLMSRLLAGGKPHERRWSPWPVLLVAGLVYLGVSAKYPALREGVVVGLSEMSDVAIVGFWGLAMVELSRMLVTVERPGFSALPLASAVALAVPIYARTVLETWLGMGTILGMDLRVVDTSAVPLAGMLSLSSALVLHSAVSTADVAGAVTRRVLNEAAAARRKLDERPKARAASELMHDVLEADRREAEAAPQPGARRAVCKACNKPMDGLQYHSHYLVEMHGLRARDVGRVRGTYQRMSESDRAALLREQENK